MAPQKLPLPHFLNLPLPTIPSDSSSSKSTNSSSSTDTSGSHTCTQPLVFKLNLSPEQFEELLNLDAEVEEGEEGGLRVEFDPSGKAALHLNPNRILQLNPPRSGPSRTNRPEEIYRHTPPSPAPSIRSSLTGLFRIPTSTTVYDLQRSQPSSDLSIRTSTQTRPVEPTKPSSKSTHQIPTNPAPPPPRPSRLATDSNRSEKEKLAGQRLKEKRLEDDRKKKEKQIALLPDAPASTLATRKTRPTKQKAPTKQTSSTNNRQPPTTVSSNATLSSRHQPLPSASIPQPLPPRRALPGSQSGKQIAHGLNQHLANPSAALPKPTPSLSQSEVLPPPQPLPVPAPPPVTFKPSSSNKRGKLATVNPSLLPDPESAPPSEPPSATKLSNSTELTSLSEKSEADSRLPDTLLQSVKPPSPPVTNFKPKEFTHPSKSSPRLNIASDEPKTYSPQPALPDATGVLSERTGSATSAHKRPVRKQAPPTASKTSDSPQVEGAPSPAANGDIPSSSSKRPRPDALTPNPTPSLPRPKKTQRRDGEERRLVDDSPALSTQSNRPRSNSGAVKPDDQPRKSGITVKKITVPATIERNSAVRTTHTEATVIGSINKKRALEPEPVAPSNPLNKRTRQEDGCSILGSALPTIRKMVRQQPPTTPVESENNHSGQGKRTKKKKKLVRKLDYTSSEVEEGEEPGEIVNVSSKTRPTVLASGSNNSQATRETEPTRAIPAQPPSTQPERPRDSYSCSQKPKAQSMSPPQPTKANGRLKPSGQVERSPEGPAVEEPTVNGVSSPSYKNMRLTFYKLLKHYEFVCARIEEYKTDHSAISNLQEVEELVFEVHGLELELDRLRNRLARTYL